MKVQRQKFKNLLNGLDTTEESFHKLEYISKKITQHKKKAIKNKKRSYG